MKYLKTLFQSLKISFSNKVFWVFAIIITIISTIGMGLDTWMAEDVNQKIIINQIKAMQNKPSLLFFLVGISVVLIILGVWILIISKNALVYYPKKIANHEEISFKQGWDLGKKNFWKVFWLNIITIIAGTAAYYLLSSPVIYLYRGGAYLTSFILGLFAFIIFIPFFSIIFFVQVYGYREIILENKNLKDAIVGAYNLFADKWKSSIAMFVVYTLAVIYVIAAFATLLVVFSLPLVIPVFILKSMNVIGAVDAGVILGIFFIPIMIFIFSLLNIYKEAVWTTFYQKIKE